MSRRTASAPRSELVQEGDQGVGGRQPDIDAIFSSHQPVVAAALGDEEFRLLRRAEPAMNRLMMTSRCASLSIMWSVYEHDDSSRPVEPGDDPAPGLAPSSALGLDPVELVVDGESFVVTRRAGSPGTYDFDWISHPASYGFTVGASFEWKPGQAELTAEIRSFLAEVDPETGYLPD